MDTYCLQRGNSNLLISVPHAGTRIPRDILERLTPVARALPDTDWFVDRLYAWANGLGASVLTASLSRYVIDLNRPPDDAPLYDTTVTSLLTGLVPDNTFSGQALYPTGAAPGAQEIRERKERYWHPFHQCLSEELERIRQAHGYAVLLDAHSIRSTQPLLFEGILPDLNLGSNGGKSAAEPLVNMARQVLGNPAYSLVVDGRFKGGYITRHYGRPANNMHVLQLEMAQSIYMQEEPPVWHDERALALQVVLQNLVKALLRWNPLHD